MRHPYEKYIRLEVMTLLLAGIIGLIAIVQGFLILMIFTLYLIGISIFFEALIALNTFQTTEGLKQSAKAAILLILATILLFHL